MEQKNFFVDYFDRFLDILKKGTPSKALTGIETWSVLGGQLLLVVALILGTISSMVSAGRWQWLSIGVLIVGLILLFVSAKFLDGLKGLVAAAPTGFSNRTIPDLLGLISVAVAVGSAIYLIVSLIQTNWLMALISLVLTAVFYVLACAFFDDEAANIQVGSQYSPGEEFISIPLLVIKAILLVLPLTFGLISLAVLIFQIAAFASPDMAMILATLVGSLPFMDKMAQTGFFAMVPLILPIYFYLGASFKSQRLKALASHFGPI